MSNTSALCFSEEHNNSPKGDFSEFYEKVSKHILTHGHPVDTGHWQALKDVPQTKTIEMRSVTLAYDIPASIEQLQEEVEPNLPWAEDHFLERVAGDPLNPGVQFEHWPFWRGGHRKDEKFSHTYMERYWPKQANIPREHRRKGRQTHGIRYAYGDLNDVVSLLAREPYTRQAYLPVWFPEDTGAVHGERVPCSLGYHFMLREGKLHCFYPIRSCDLIRHLRDDVYLTARLVQWVLDRLQVLEFHEESGSRVRGPWNYVIPGELTMFMHSLHVFEGDYKLMTRKKK